MSEIRALSIRQPWVELILRGNKTIEIRTWSTEYRGKLWLHASQRSDPYNEERFHVQGAFKGGYVGSIILAGIVPFDLERWREWRPKHLDQGPFQLKTYAWLLSSPVRFKEPIPARGFPSLFYPTKDDLQKLLKSKTK